MSAGADRPSRYLSLDHWRGFAALWVLVYHANRGQPPLEPAFVGEFVRHGWLGVPVFFVVSGYCIAERMYREHETRGSTSRFLVDRLLRIYPPYWAAVLLTAAINVASALVRGVPLSSPAILPDGLTGWIMSLACVELWFDRATFHLVAWTLAYEVGFYFCAAGGLALMRQTGRWWAGFGFWGLLLGIALVPGVGSWIPLLQLWPEFALGGLVWLAWRGGRALPTRLWLAGGAILLTTATAIWVTPALALSFTAAGTCAVLLLTLRLWDAQLAALVPLRWLGWIGTFSYSLYLAHAPIVGKFEALFSHVSVLASRPLVAAGLSCLCTLPLMWCYYQLVEKPSERFRRSTMKHLSARPH
jgi:peptidoglycan/LPS O-acetylase OafA/YrhL